MSLIIQRLSVNSAAYDQDLKQLLTWEPSNHADVEETVRTILRDVQQQGDSALLAYTQRFDQRPEALIQDLTVPAAALQQALARIPLEQRKALEAAADNIRSFHQHQQQVSWHYRTADGNLLGQQVRPMDRVGVYVPGGKAAYPSSVLMTVIPAQVAGVQEIIMVTPALKGELNDMVLAAAAIAGVHSVFSIGGAQAIAALAYGTASIPKVDKIVGPGNIYVATAKRSVFGLVDIDMIAGPSEILVVCDGDTSPDWIAMDLCSQAEHDEQAQAILISPDIDFLNAVDKALHRLVPKLQRQAIVRESLAKRGALIYVRDMIQAMDLINQIAPEHLELSVDQPEQWLPHIRHAGAIFMGRYTSEALGDYCAGPNHVLPTSGTARFSSPLGVYDFQKRSSIIQCSEQGATALGKIASVLARGESLEAHARSAEYRIFE